MAETQNNPGGTPPTPLPPATAGGQSPAGPPSPSAVASVPLFGGHRGGRPRKDGLVPGSPEAIAADREKERLRKEAARAVARKLEQPAPLPSKPAPDVNTALPPSVSGNPDPVAQVAEFVAWVPEDVRPLLDELIPLLEQEAVNGHVNKCHEAKLPPKIVAEIERDARWRQGTKVGLSRGGAEVLVKYLNQFGIDARNKAEVMLGLALIHLVMHNRQISRRIERVIEAQTGKPTEQKKP